MAFASRLDAAVWASPSLGACVGAYFLYLSVGKPAAASDSSELDQQKSNERSVEKSFLGDDHDAVHMANAAAQRENKRAAAVEEPEENLQSEVVGDQDYHVKLDEQRKQRGYDGYGFNEALSETIPLKRAVPDLRHNL